MLGLNADRIKCLQIRKSIIKIHKYKNTCQWNYLVTQNVWKGSFQCCLNKMRLNAVINCFEEQEDKRF